MKKILLITLIILFYVCAHAAQQTITGGAGAAHQWSVQQGRINANFTELYGWGDQVGLYSLVDHLHDTRYYTEAEIDTALGLKYGVGDNPTFGTITYSMLSSSAADGTHYNEAINTIAITATAITGRFAYFNDRIWLADGTNWITRYVLDSSFVGQVVQAYDADLTDLADGILSGSKIGVGISATNITTGTLSAARLPATVPIGPNSMEIFVLDDCATATGMSVGDLCFEY